MKDKKILNRTGNYGRLLLVVFIVLTIVLASCQQPTLTASPEAPPTEAPPPTEEPAPEPPVEEAPEEPQPAAEVPAELLGVEWVLIGTGDALNPIVVEPGTRPTAVFGTDGNLNGLGGCNTFNTTFQVDGANINFGPAVSTMMACEIGMEQEAAYLSALETASSYVVEGNRLLIHYDSGAGYDEQLVYVAETPLTDTLWVLVSYGDPNDLTPTQSGVMTTAIFGADGNMSGSAGCNSYNAGYSVESGQISVGLPNVTMMACEIGMEQEAAYLAALESAETYRIGNGFLEITFAGGTGVLRFSARHMPLENVHWVLTMIDGQPVLEGTEATAIFTPGGSSASPGPDNSVNGNASCNSFFGAYSMDGNSLSVPGPLGMTQMMCEEGVMEQESAFLAGLESAQSYETTLNSLVITTASGSMVLYADRMPLEGPVWTLTSFGTLENPRPPIEGANFTAIIARQFGMPSGLMAGTTGCNDYTAGYYASLRDIKVNLPNTTQQSCGDAMAEEEQAFFLGLNAAREYRILGNEMQIFYDSYVLTFLGAYPPGDVSAGPLTPLDGTKWWLYSNDTFLTIPGTEVTAEFSINSDGVTGKINGTGGCNTYNADLLDVFLVSTPVVTQMACENPSGIMEQESAYLSALASAYSFSLEGDTLKIITDLGVLVFTNTGPGAEQPLPPTETPEAVQPLPPTAPAAVIDAPTEGQVNVVITFDGSASTSDIEITSFEWDLGDGGTAEGVTVEHAYEAAGTYTVTLIVTDANGQTGVATIEVTIT